MHGVEQILPLSYENNQNFPRFQRDFDLRVRYLMLQEQFQHHRLHRWPFVFENQLTFILQGRGEKKTES
jgi:hypothetical protein